MTTEDSGNPAATAGDHPDAKLLRLKREIENASKAGNAAATDKEAEPFLDLATKLRHELAEIPAHTVEGIIAKFDEYQRIHSASSGSVWDEAFLRTIREALDRVNFSTPVDAALFALEVEMRTAHEGLDAAPSDNEAHQPWYDRMIAAEETALAIPAQTAAGVLAKLRMAVWYQNPKPSPDDASHEIWLRSIVADAERLGGSS